MIVVFFFSAQRVILQPKFAFVIAFALLNANFSFSLKKHLLK
jgi:hypothetical protein